MYIENLLLVRNRVEWTKGICQIWSRGRHFSPSLPGDRYLKLNSQKRSPGRNLGEHRLVRRSGTASRGTACFVFYLRMRSFLDLKLLPHFSTNIGQLNIGQLNTSCCWCCVPILGYFILPVLWSRELEIKFIGGLVLQNFVWTFESTFCTADLRPLMHASEKQNSIFVSYTL